MALYDKKFALNMFHLGGGGGGGGEEGGYPRAPALSK